MENVTISKHEYRELLYYKQIILDVEEEIHERPFKEEFVKETLKIREEMTKGKKSPVFKSTQEMEAYLKTLKE
ncbi:MAG: hypothetical protein AABX38_07965 [Candidatus Micrarchaeota archaeon]